MVGSIFVLCVGTASGGWRYNPVAWHVADGVATAQKAGSFALLADEDRDAMTLSVKVTPTELNADSQWSELSIAVYRDEGNYWRLSMLAAPDLGRHSFALIECRAWRTHTHNELKAAPPLINEAEDCWRIGETYTLKLILTKESIAGEVRDAKGALLFRQGYLLDGRAVDFGVPAIRSGGGLKGRFVPVAYEASGKVCNPSPDWGGKPYRFPSNAPWIRGKATGYFHTEKIDGKWWVIDPDGHGFLVNGVDHVRYDGIYCAAENRRHYKEHNDRTYKAKWQWAKETADRMRTWGFNLTAAESEVTHHVEIPYTDFVAVGSLVSDAKSFGDAFNITPHQGRPCTAFPNVFHPDFARTVDYFVCRAARRKRTDPWFVGYFLDNELAWRGRDGESDTGLLAAVMAKDASHTAKRAAMEFLFAKCGGKLASFNAFWGTQLARKEDFLELGTLDFSTVTRRAAGSDFLAWTAERYFKVMTDAIRRHDPNHLILGCRFAHPSLMGAHPKVWSAAGKYCDIVSVNCYPDADLETGGLFIREWPGQFPRTPLMEQMKRLHQWSCAKPILVSEWSFMARDTGHPCTHGTGMVLDTQRERAAAAEIFLRAIHDAPFCVGADYFMWVDEPKAGGTATHPENCNYGLVSEEGVPYRELTEMFARVMLGERSARRNGGRDPILKVGFITDNHLHGAHPLFTEISEQAVKLFAEEQVDVLVDAGDITDSYQPAMMKVLREMIEKHCAAKPPRLLTIPANHETLGTAIKNRDVIYANCAKVFGMDDVSPFFEANGFRFVSLAQFESIETVLKPRLDAAVAESPRGRPVIVVTHAPPKGTVNGSHGRNGDAGLRTFFQDYPQVIVLSGHSHAEIGVPESVWRGAFIVVNGGTLQYGWDHDVTPWRRSCVRAATVLEFYGDEMRVRPFYLGVRPIELDTLTIPYLNNPSTIQGGKQ